MSKLLRSGLTLLGVGVVAAGGIFFSKWGPCGPSSIVGLVCLLTAGICVMLGSLFLVVGLLKLALHRVREGMAS
jgi:hypothetical protein